MQQSIDISCLPSPQHVAVLDSWDRQTDGHRTITQTLLHTIPGVSITSIQRLPHNSSAVLQKQTTTIKTYIKQLSCQQGCSGAGTHGNAVPVSILAREQRSHKCVSCKWERWCYSVPINISNSRSFSFTYGHGCRVRRDSPTWNMQRVQQ